MPDWGVTPLGSAPDASERGCYNRGASVEVGGAGTQRKFRLMSRMSPQVTRQEDLWSSTVTASIVAMYLVF